MKRLGLGEYQLEAPGMEAPMRVTTRRDFYEEHAGSVELWSPGSSLFPAPDDVVSAEEAEATGRLASLLDARKTDGS